jgi:GLPGLI family protein
MYEYTFKPDSTNSKDITKDIMFLDIVNDKSLFYSAHKYKEDSTSIAEASKGKFYIPSSQVNYRIEKENGKTFFFISDYGFDKLKVVDDRKQDWKISPDKQKIGEYNTQKASTEFAGRKWTAWFTTDIPFQDGPYKFRGLPGLILKLEDSTESHIFVLKGIKNITEITYPDLNSRASEVVLSQSKFRDIFMKYRKDPAAATKQLYIQNKIPDQKDSSGNFRTGAEIVREVEKLAKERIDKDNNIIELDLLK